VIEVISATAAPAGGREWPLPRCRGALRLILAELHMATVRAQTSVPLLPTFTTGVYGPTEPLTASVDTMLAQLLVQAKGMRAVREARVIAMA
jgi:NAD(P)H-dependent FMN reductase